MSNSGDAQPGLYNWLGGYVKRFVRWWRWLDAVVNQPLPEGRAWYWTWLAPHGYAWFVPILSILLIATMALGPTFRFAPANIALLILGLGLLLGLHIGASRKPWIQQYLLAGQLVILGVLAILLLFLAWPETFGDRSGSLRLHIGVAVTIVLVIALGGVWLLARWLFRPIGDGGLAGALPGVELFPPKDSYDYIGASPIAALGSAMLIVPVRYPVELLLPGSLLVLFVPDRFLVWVFVIVGLVSWAALFLGTLFERLMEILKTIGRLFFIGPQFAISVVVIVFAVLRLLDVHYVTYLFNAGSGGYGNTTIMIYVALAYLAAWYYAFWSDQLVARRLIRLLGAGGTATPLQVPYPYDGRQHLTPIKPEGRTIALHGAGRLKIQGEYEEGYEAKGTVLHFQTPAELLATFRSRIEQIPEMKTLDPDLLANLRNFQRSALVYPVITSALAFVLIGGPILLTFYHAVQPPELEIHRTRAVELDPKSLLLSEDTANGACGPLEPNDPRIAVIASGGGTRAAIYTASVLHGLAEQGKICNVVLVSGVSGGSAALAYFALHERELRRPGKPDDMAWKNFSETMALPFIEYTLDGASDLRITFGRWAWQKAACGEKAQEDRQVLGWMPARSRLGHILAESFVCTMGHGVMADASFGVMMNTAMLGSFDAGSVPCRGTNLPLPEHATRCRDVLDGSVAGGRLVLTNLLAPKPNPPADPSAAMKLAALDDASLSIARAAALSANFPPVFSDAAIDVLPAGERYWVTDGGAVENRGAMSLYLFIRDAMKSVPLSSRPAPLHFVIADVSASAGGYEESFGLSSVLGAGGQLGLGIEGEVLADIKDIYCKRRSTATVHEITMPAVLRSGIGTHWLLPGSLTFTEPTKNDSVTLYADDVKRLVFALHSMGSRDFDYPDDASKVLGWALTDPGHKQNWSVLMETLSKADASGTPCFN